MLSFAQIASLATRIILSVFLINETPRVKSELVNVAIGKSTSQFGERWPSRNAVDGQKGCMTVDKQYFALTYDSHLPWWEVNLGDQFRIQEIIVHGRHDGTTNQLHGFRLYLSSSNQFTENNIVYTNTDYNGGTISIALNLKRLFQFVKLDLPDTYRSTLYDKGNDKQAGPLVLCEVEVFVNMINIALGKPASMSTVYDGMTADRSVDGHAGRTPNICKCCSHSTSEPNPWLKIDLLHPYKIYLITVLGRSDDYRDNRMIGGIEIHINSSQNLAIGNNTIGNESVVTVSFLSGIISNNVKLTRPGNGEWYLVVCEVKIYVKELDCQTGTYRDYKVYQCKNCGHCKGEPCNKENGSCPEGGCMAGWTGTECNITCRDGHYGENCLENCTANCLGGNSQCSKADGKCQQGCMKGYQGDKCKSQCPSSKYSYNCNETCTTCTQKNCTNVDGGCLNGCIPGYKTTDLYCREVCDDGLYGQNCSHHCSGHCKGGDHQCNKTNGKCMQGCVAGYTGERCEAKCLPGLYGPGCTEACHHCKNGTTCDYQSGNCPKGCNLGFEGKLCDKECQDGYFGDCSHRCHCMGHVSCQKTDGVCTGTCAFGWSGKNCSLVCDEGKYGRGCRHTCHCSDEKSCDSITGKCKEPGCFPGWRGDSCNFKCESKSFGKNCSQTCHCINGTNCDNVNGQCDEQECDPGWIGASCQTKCESKYFGKNCSQTCHCINGTNCDNVNGQCDEHECDPGWIGTSCQTKCESKSFGKNCSQTCHCINGTNCDNVNGQCDEHECDPGWIGASCQTNENILSQLKNEIKTSMSTVVGNWTSDRAVDGDTGPDPDKCQCCSGTTNAHMSWWMVDFSQSIPIKGIWIYSRNNEKDYSQLVGFQIVLSDRIVRNTSSVLYRRSGDFSSIYEMSLPNVLTRFLKIQRPGVLTLCEVKVIQGVCKNGRFGRECEQECHCADKKQCDQITGYCQFPACKTGWQGLACNETCPLDTFGDNCNDICYCAEGTCTNNYGICPGECRQGYHGPHCNQVGSEMKSRTALIWGAVGSAGALLIIGVIIGIVVLYIRRKRRPSRKNEYETPNLYVTPTETQEYDTIENIYGSEHSNRIARGIETETEFQNK